MLIEQRVVLSLIKKSQYESDDWDRIDSECDWTAVYKEAERQAILGIIAPEVPIEVADSDERWKRAQYLNTANFIRYISAEDDLIRCLENHGITMVILKGNASAIYYRNPSRRTMGDIDILVNPESFDRAKDLLVSNGYELLHKDFNEVRHVSFMKNGLLFEVHHHFSHNDVDIDEYLIKGLQNRENRIIEGHEFPMLSPLENGLVLLDHIRSHLRRGLGLRQVIDWMLYVHEVLDDAFWNEEFCLVVRKLGMEKLAITLTRMCQIYMGLPDSITWCRKTDETVCDELIENLFNSGNFGNKNGDGSRVEGIAARIKQYGLFRWLQIAGEGEWKAYQKHRWLKPFCWVYQITVYIKKGIKANRSVFQMSDDIKRANKRDELLKKLGV